MGFMCFSALIIDFWIIEEPPDRIILHGYLIQNKYEFSITFNKEEIEGCFG